MTADELTDEQQQGLVQLTSALDALGKALVYCRDNGLAPADAFRAAGIPIPSFAGPMLNQMFKASEETPLQQLQQV